MSGSVHDLHLHVTDVEALPIRELAVGHRRLLERNPINLRLPCGCFIEPAIERMEIDGYVPATLDRGDSADVVHMCMSDPDGVQLGGGLIDCFYELVAVAARVDHDCSVGAIVDRQVRILLECADGERHNIQVYPPALTCELS